MFIVFYILKKEKRTARGVTKGAGLGLKRGWRMTGSAFASLWVAAQDVVDIFGLRRIFYISKGGFRFREERAPIASDRRLADDGKRLSELSRRWTL